MANTTKRMLALCLKNQLTHTTLDNITIRELTDEAGVRLKTFYYHFHDIYDLLEWTLIDDASHLLQACSKGGSWDGALQKIIDSIDENREIVINAYRSLDRSALERYVSCLVTPMIGMLFSSFPGHDRLSQQDRDFIVHIYSFGLTGMLLVWIANDLQFKAPEMHEQTVRFLTCTLSDWIDRCTRGDFSTKPDLL